MMLSLSVYGEKTPIQRDLYLKAGEISITSPEYFHYGMVDDLKKGVTKITLLDVMKYEGHLCPGSVSGFLIAQKGIKALFPKGDVARGMVSVTGSTPSGTLDTLAMIFGAREHFGEKQKDFKIDEKLFNPQNITVVLTRKDTKQSVTFVFHKMKAFKVLKKSAKLFKKLRGKVKKGVATDQEIKQLGKMIRQLIKNILDHHNQLITQSK